ncbi:MAG: adenine deaminase [Nitrospirota bacterium]
MSRLLFRGMDFDRAHFLAVARGERPADVVFRGGRLVNVLTGEVYRCDVAVAAGRVAALGEGFDGMTMVDVTGRYLAPGLIDAHCHVESTLVPPAELARVAAAHGVTTLVADTHEIANVLGPDGIRYMATDARGAPARFVFQAPSCVPATPLATSGGRLDAADLAGLRTEGVVWGLAEVMDVPGAAGGNPEVTAKIAAFTDRPVDGHAPGLTPPLLDAYCAAGVTNDHESTTVAEGRDKLRRGMAVFLREGSVARDLITLLPLVTPEQERRLALCTDDRHPDDLLAKGTIDHAVRRAIAGGVPPVTALRLATLNAADLLGLSDRGALVPGRLADLIVFDDLEAPRPSQVYLAGRLVAEDGALPPHIPNIVPPAVRDTVHIDWDGIDLRLPAQIGAMRAMRLHPDDLWTDEVWVGPRVENGLVVADPDRDLAKLVVIERHTASGRVGRALLANLGLRRGAIASTVCHDHHNLIAAGADDRSLLTAARAVAEAGGGLAVAVNETVAALLPLPIAGLMSDQPIEDVAAALGRIVAAARDLGVTPPHPVMSLSFLGLEVIPALKLTDRGLIDVAQQTVVAPFAEQPVST